MDFGEALQILKGGGCVARQGWNGKGMYLFFVSPTGYFIRSAPEQLGKEPVELKQRAWIAMRTADAGVVPWLASQSDLLEEDWVIYDT